MTTVTPPKWRAASFNCPKCGAFAQQTWAICYAQTSEEEYDPGLSVAKCFACGDHSIWRVGYDWSFTPPRETGTLVHPHSTTFGPPQHDEMPEDVASLYSEASAVAATSPRSASALLRLALEVLLKGIYPDAGNLNATIGAAVADGLPKQVQQTMDFMRFNGNQSVHQFHHDDTAETATTLFNLLNVVVEHLISQPKQLDQLYAGLPDGFKKQVDQRDTANSD